MYCDVIMSNVLYFDLKKGCAGLGGHLYPESGPYIFQKEINPLWAAQQACVYSQKIDGQKAETLKGKRYDDVLILDFFFPF